VIALGYGKRSAEKMLLCALEDGEPLEAGSRTDGLLVSRLDFDLQVLDIPSVPEKEVEGLIKYRLRSIYPGNPAETAFDYRLETDGKLTRAVVFICKKPVLDAYRLAAGQTPLLLPYSLIAGMAKKMRNCRVLFCHRDWTEHLVFRNGLPVSSSARRRAKGKRADPGWIDGEMSGETRELPVIVIASELDIADLKIALHEKTAQSPTFLTFDAILASQKKPSALFAPHRRESALFAPKARMAALAGAVAILGVLLFIKLVSHAETDVNALKALYSSLESRNRTVLTLQKEVDELNAELSKLQAEKPQDLYALLSELSAVLGGEARIKSMTFQGEAFQVEAIGSNPLKLMEGFKDLPSFRNVRLSQVVPDAVSGKERFSFSGVFHAR
jgi:hypothetical protein